MAQSSFAGRYKVGMRIYAGFSAVILLMVIVAVIGSRGFSNVESSMARYGTISENAERVATLQRYVAEMRRNVRLYASSGNARYLAATRDTQKVLNDLLAETVKNMLDAQRKAGLERLIGLVESYNEDFEKLIGVRQGRDKAIRETLPPLGVQIQAGLADIMSGALADMDFDVATRAGVLLQKIMGGRLMVMHFTDEPEEGALPRIRGLFNELVTGLKGISNGLTDPRLHKVGADIERAGVTYRDGLDSAFAAIMETDRILNLMADKATDFATLAGEIGESQHKALAATRAGMEDTIGRASGLQSLVSIIAVVMGGLLAWLIARGITMPLEGMTMTMTMLAGGARDVDIPALGNRDEIGAMAKAVQVFKSNAIENQRLKDAQDAESRAKLCRQQEADELIDMFASSVSGVFQTLSHATATMAHTAESMKGVVDQTHTQIEVVTNEVADADSNSQAVAAASQQLTAAIGEISRLVNSSSQVAEQGAAQAGDVLRGVTTLREASEQIGNVVAIISSIASQTNLLALNATIEAARAGEAGRGFAVVAGEVKNLSAQTQKATVEIAAQIAEIQNSIGGTANAVQLIGQTVSQIYESTSEIAAAITEQQSATDEIARNIQFVSASTGRIAGSMTLVRDSASHTNSASQEVHTAASSMSSQSEKLSTEVRDFLVAVKSVGTRHEFQRLDTDLRAQVTAGGTTQATHVRQLSIGGAWLDVRVDQPPGSLVEIAIDGMAQPIKARIAGLADKGTRLQFPMDEAHLTLMADALTRLGRPAA
jgi:methyl-accepting chemotaxis protein